MFLTSLLSILMYIKAENNADQLRTILVMFFPYKLAGVCTKIFQIFLPNFRPSKNHCALEHFLSFRYRYHFYYSTVKDSCAQLTVYQGSPIMELFMYV